MYLKTIVLASAIAFALSSQVFAQKVFDWRYPFGAQSRHDCMVRFIESKGLKAAWEGKVKDPRPTRRDIEQAAGTYCDKNKTKVVIQP